MTTLVSTLNRARTVEMDQTSWAVVAIMFSAAAINVVPIACGGAAYYAASKADSKFLKAVAAASTFTGIILGVMAAI